MEFVRVDCLWSHPEASSHYPGTRDSNRDGVTRASKQPAGYRYEVSWSDEDGQYVATCAEFPSLSWLAPSAEGALAGLRRVVADVMADRGDTSG